MVNGAIRFYRVHGLACLRLYEWMLVALYVLSVIGSLEATLVTFEYVCRIDLGFAL
jgi:hypothetical protein